MSRIVDKLFHAHNVCCVIAAMYELGIDPAFVGLNGEPDDGTRAILKFPGVG